MSLYALLKEFASACINRTESEIHSAATALHNHFHPEVAKVEEVVAKVEAAPAAVEAEVKAEVVQQIEDMTP